jgi:hypothetical protein
VLPVYDTVYVPGSSVQLPSAAYQAYASYDSPVTVRRTRFTIWRLGQ